MAELAVPLALALVDTVAKIYLHKSTHRQTTIEVDLRKAQNCLRRMEAYIEDSSQQIDESSSQALDTRVKEVQELAYEIADALDKFMLKNPHHIHSKFTQKMHDGAHIFSNKRASKELSTNINGVFKKMELIPLLDSVCPHVPARSRPSSSTGMTHHNHVLEEEIVGFEELEKKIFEQLITGDSSLTKISIQGPGGSGKSTLAKKVYNNKQVQEFFDCRAWVDMPRSVILSELFQIILRKFKMKRQKAPLLHGENDDAKAQLNQYLQKKRFLVVLDNVWSEEDLKCVVNAFSDGHEGSRIIMTTRNCDVVSSLSSKLCVHDLSNGLPWEKQVDLFCKKVFQSEESCPQELEEWAIKILNRCEGLPLAISALGSFLSTKPKTTVEWRKFHHSLGSQLRHVLQPSYKDLPSYLKACFLYFSIFPEDYSIQRQRLVRLWVAEGFVKSENGITREQVAEDYLNELIRRNLVQTSSRDTDGRVRSCRVSNLVRDFIISKSDNFITVLKPDNGRTSGASGEKVRRLSTHNAGDTLLQFGNYDFTHNHTLLLHPQKSFRFDDLKRLVETFQCLRVLDLQGVPLENFPDNVTALTLLKYLSLRDSKIKEIPKSIKNLAQLETLDLKHTQVTILPKEIYKLHNMRHLLVYHYEPYEVRNYVMFGDAQGVEISQSMVSTGNIGALSSMQKLSLIKVKNNRKLIKALGMLTGLRKLGLTDLQTQDGKELCLAIQNMEDLSTFDVRSTSAEEYLDLDHAMQPKPFPSDLQKLYLTGRLERLPRWIPGLRSLTRIGLKWSKLKVGNPLEALQDLPNLKQLELVDYYTGEELVFRTKTFEKLKILHVEQFEGLNRMKVESGAMPMLNKLTLCNCQNLKLLPVFDGLELLEELMLYDMNEELIFKLQEDSEERLAYKHVRVIHSFSLGINQPSTRSKFKNLSPSKW